jgi:RNA polymerase sigma factor (sigma-70 family)
MEELPDGGTPVGREGALPSGGNGAGVPGRGAGYPPELSTLLEARSSEARRRAWERFVRQHSRLILKVAHQSSRHYDGAMDHYTFVLERLRDDDFDRLRRYRSSGSQFTTWLVVVVRRLCLDHHRQVYGRPRSSGNGASPEHHARRRLVDFVVDEIDPERTRHNGKSPDAGIRRQELLEALEAALATVSPEDRLTLRLRFEDGAPAADIARVLGLPTVFHAYRRIKKILERLRVELEANGVHGPLP